MCQTPKATLGTNAFAACCTAPWHLPPIIWPAACSTSLGGAAPACRPSTAFCRALDAEEEYNEIDEMATGMIARRQGSDVLPPRHMQARAASARFWWHRWLRCTA